MAKHLWVELSMIPVELEVKGDEIIVHASEAAIEAADDQKRLGCWFCDEQPTLDNLDEVCIPSSQGPTN